MNDLNQAQRRAERNRKSGLEDLMHSAPRVRGALGLSRTRRTSARYGYGLPPHPQLDALLRAQDGVIREQLAALLTVSDAISAIPIKSIDSPTQPRWHNPYFYGLDGVALYGLVAVNRPRLYIEVGSGYSTMFARCAVADCGLVTRMVSIDPEPRVAIDSLCNSVIRRPLEEVDLRIFEELGAGDILFIDSSHICNMGSDVAVFFLDVVPRLASGVLVQLHDIFLPWDYRPDWLDRGYSEQYMLAAYLLGGGRMEVILPNFYIFINPSLSAMLDDIWSRLSLTGYETAGHSFWMRVR